MSCHARVVDFPYLFLSGIPTRESRIDQLKRKFRLVFFTPGNHDVWLDHQTRKLLKEKIESSNSRPISDELLDSYGKLKYILKECNKQGILTAPTLVCGSEVSSSGSVSSSACQNTKDSGVLDTVQSSPSSPLCSLSNCSPDDPQRTSDDYCTSTSDKVWIVPILSWHHPEFDTEPKIAHVGGQEVPPPEKLIQDFSRCLWPFPHYGAAANQRDVAMLVDKLNDDNLPDNFRWNRQELRQLGSSPTTPVISLSHFIPNENLLPEKRFLFYPDLPSACGSHFLRERIASLCPHAHIFGHTHFGWDMNLEGVRYIQAPLGYPRERRMRPRSMEMRRSTDREPQRLLLVWEDGKWVAPYSTHWSDYYKSNPRTPEDITVAPHVLAAWNSIGALPKHG
eukprot:GHVT01075483.1.p1 GENE.GHVT01075483.1~~GHVT01075483.1.p1  ORF type:complete len:394 (+),score=18.58 GHVT01075483.1:549-1730(+)